ncbi:monocarboxylate transporter 11-like, partial [Haliotis rubra]|uniref:monocarboxylate transporter 11-like n=1 Tax=Haliotis rubra TaxID=36100 RepID=UPI001EE5D573
MTSVYIITLSSGAEQSSLTPEVSSYSCQPRVDDASIDAGSHLDKDVQNDSKVQIDISGAHLSNSHSHGHDKTCSDRLEDTNVSFTHVGDVEEAIDSMSPKDHPTSRSPSLTIRDVGLVFAGFVLHLFTQGLGNSYGVVYTHLKEMEGFSDYQLSWIGSLMAGMLGVGAILGSYLIEGVGWRLTSIVGGLLLTLGMVLSAMVTNLYLLYLCLGVMPGIGAALCQLAAIVCISHQFGKGLPLALCLMATGGAIGMLAFPLVWSLVLDNFGWRGALLRIGAISLN